MGELSARVSRERRACLRAQEELEALQAELASQVPVPFFLPVLASGPSRVPASTAPQQRPRAPAPAHLRADSEVCPGEPGGTGGEAARPLWASAVPSVQWRPPSCPAGVHWGV